MIIKQLLEELIPFNKLLGMEVVHVGEGEVRMRLPFKDAFIGDITKPAMHGGVISALLDAAGGGAVFTQVGPGDRLSTIDLLVDYLRPCPPAALMAHAKVVRIGGRVALVQLACSPEAEPEKLVASGRAAYNIKRMKQ
jgi:uncharacterized protein (TIGR00369 family)